MEDSIADPFDNGKLATANFLNLYDTYKNKLSEYKENNYYGVLQGPVLGSLFLMYINDNMCNLREKSKPTLYADAAFFICNRKSLTEVERKCG